MPKNKIHKVLSYLFPNFTCLVCGCELRYQTDCEHICHECFANIKHADQPINNAKVVLKLEQDTVKLRKVIAPFTYNKEISKPILLLKYGNDGLTAEAFAPFMQRNINITDYDIIIPIPLSKSRQRQRGYNQAQVIADYVIKEKTPPFRKDILFKTKKTTPQENMTTKERLENQKDAYVIKEENAVKNLRILLIDDVITSGATTNEAASILIKHGAKYVDILAIARVEK
ncbi:MAG: ComF family protein [Firmicutes bacterium]|nr:ComF family protein [Bacillota bacterium]